MEKRKLNKRKRELLRVFQTLPDAKMTILKTTIDTVAFMDLQLSDLETLISEGIASTPDKQLYASLAKTRDVLMKKLLQELPPEEEDDGFDDF